MPALYLLAGLIVVSTLHNVAGRFSGALLIVAAIAILAMRRLGARGERETREASTSRHPSAFAPASRLATTTEFVRAILPPELGHVDIDRQHRSLASRAASLRVALAHADEPADLELAIHELIDAFAHHVAAEIELLGRLGVARPQADIDADRARLAGAERDFESWRSGGLTLQVLVDRVAGPLVAGHLASRHPPLPSMESMLQQLREAKAAS